MKLLGKLGKRYKLVNVQETTEDGMENRIEFRLKPGAEINDKLYSKITKDLEKRDLRNTKVYLIPAEEDKIELEPKVLEAYADRLVESRQTNFGLNTSFGPAFSILAAVINPITAIVTIPAMCVGNYISNKRSTRAQNLLEHLRTAAEEDKLNYFEEKVDTGVSEVYDKIDGLKDEIKDLQVNLTAIPSTQTDITSKLEGLITQMAKFDGLFNQVGYLTAMMDNKNLAPTGGMISSQIPDFTGGRYLPTNPQFPAPAPMLNA